jgi:hypothetical protein
MHFLKQFIIITGILVTNQNSAMKMVDLHKKVYLSKVANNSDSPITIGTHKTITCRDFDEANHLVSVDSEVDVLMKEEIPMRICREEVHEFGSSCAVELMAFLKVQTSNQPDICTTIGVQKNYYIGQNYAFLQASIWKANRLHSYPGHSVSQRFTPYYPSEKKQNVSLLTLLIDKDYKVTVNLDSEEVTNQD